MLCASTAATVESTAPQAARLRNIAIMTVLRGWACLPGCFGFALEASLPSPHARPGRRLMNVQSVLSELRSTPPVGFQHAERAIDDAAPSPLCGASGTAGNANSVPRSGVRNFH